MRYPVSLPHNSVDAGQPIPGRGLPLIPHLQRFGVIARCRRDPRRLVVLEVIERQGIEQLIPYCALLSRTTF